MDRREQIMTWLRTKVSPDLAEKLEANRQRNLDSLALRRATLVRIEEWFHGEFLAGRSSDEEFLKRRGELWKRYERHVKRHEKHFGRTERRCNEIMALWEAREKA